MIYVTSYKKSITQQTIWTIRQDSLQEQVAAGVDIERSACPELEIREMLEYISPRFGFVPCCLSCYCQQSHNTLSILQYLYEQIQIIPPQAFIYIRRQMLDVGTNYHKQYSVPCIDANKFLSKGGEPGAARLSLSNSSTPDCMGNRTSSPRL